MSRGTTLHDQSSFLGHQGGYSALMRQHPDSQGAGGYRRPSRLLQMREDYQRRLMKEKEERMVNAYEEHRRKTLERADRVAKPPGGNEEYPKSKLRQPGYMQPPPPPPPAQPIRDFFRERKDLESKGVFMPPINQHFKDSRTPNPRNPRIGSGGRTLQKNSAGVDRGNPLAPIQARHGGVSSAPAKPTDGRNNKTRLVKQDSSSPDFDSHGHVKPHQKPSPVKKPSAPAAGAARGNLSSGRGSGISSKAEKLSDFQKWQMEQNRAREERLKKLNMRAPRESTDWGQDYEYEDEEEEGDEEDTIGAIEEEEGGPGEEIQRREQELLQRIAHQQAELDRLKRAREEEEELERQEAERLRKQQAADRERRKRQQQEDARRRREEEAEARREEEDQRLAARARQERQRFEAHLDQFGDSLLDDSPRYPSQPNSHRENPNSYRENPFQPNSYRENPNSQREDPFQASNSHCSGNNAGYGRDSSSNNQALTPKYTPKPPSQGTPKRTPAKTHHPQQAPQRKPAAPPAEDFDEIRVPGPGVEVYAQAVDDEQGVRVRLVSCKECGRKFADDRIEKHQSACKNAHKKRKAFDPTQMRTDGTEMAQYIRRGTHKKEPKTKKKANWRQEHQEFIANIRYAKQLQQMEQQGVAPKDLPPPPPTKAREDMVPCPHCGRTFNEHAAERHIPRCQGLKTRPVANNNNRRRH
ncbi:hypothetical protein ACOMHN_064467 [Nucella lapillus]